MMHVRTFFPVLWMGCHLGRPPQTPVGRNLELSAWGPQPGLEQLLERELMTAILNLDTDHLEDLQIKLTSYQEVPQVFFPTQGTLWLLRLEVEVSGQNLTEPLRLVGQAHYTFETADQFTLSRQNAYLQAVSQVSEQLGSGLGYQNPNTIDDER